MTAPVVDREHARLIAEARADVGGVVPLSSTAPGPAPFDVRHILAGNPPTAPAMLVHRLILDGDVTMFGGKGGAGKSVALLHVAVAVALGRPAFGSLAVNRPGPVLLVCPEDGEGFVRMALDAIIAAEGLEDRRRELADRLAIVADDQLVNLAVDANRLAATARELGAVLVILDPLRNLIPGAEETDNDVAAAVLDDLRRRVCREAGAAVAIAAHVRKANREDREADPSADDLRGASAWVNGSRLVFAIAKPLSGDTLTVSCLKANRLRPADLKHRLTLAIEAEPANPAAWHACRLTDANTGAESESYTPGLARPLNDTERDALDALDDSLEPGGALSWSAWCKRSGLKDDTFDKVRRRLIKHELAASTATGNKTRTGKPEYVYHITDTGRRALLNGGNMPHE